MESSHMFGQVLLLGAVLATTIANLVALLLLGAINHRLGCRMDFGTRVTLAVPLFYWLGPWVSLACLGAIVIEALHSDRILSAQEKRQLAEGLATYWERFRSLPAALKSMARPSSW